MRKTFFNLAGIAASLFFVGSAVAADNYKWCANTSGGMGASNCGFETLEQCRATVSGTGGFCDPNPFYKGSRAEEKSAKPKPKRNPG